MELKQSIVVLPSGLQAILDELKDKEFTDLVQADETGVEYLSGGIHRLYTVPSGDRYIPCIALLLGPAKIIDQLASIDWENAKILALGERGGTDLYELINSDPSVRVIYDSYIPPHLPYLTAEGTETEEDTGIENPIAGDINKQLGKWA